MNEEWVGECVGGWITISMDGWTGGWMGKRTNESVKR